MRMQGKIKSIGIMFGLLVLGGLVCSADSLVNQDFESGTLDGWTVSASQMTIGARTNNAFNRTYAAAITGAYASSTWITNKISQTIQTAAGDDLVALGFVAWPTQTLGSASATGQLQATLSGPFGTNTKVWTQPFVGWGYFNLEGGLFGIKDSGFESGGFSYWEAACDDLTATITTSLVYEGSYALKMEGSWSNGWSWNEVRQLVYLQSGDVVRARWVANWPNFTRTSNTCSVVAGIKLELDSSNQWEQAFSPPSTTNHWYTNGLIMYASIKKSGTYTYRVMVCGTCPEGESTTAELYFDNVTLVKTNAGYTGEVANATLELKYTGYSGGASCTNKTEIYFDMPMIQGSSANAEAPDDIYTWLCEGAQTAGTNSQYFASIDYAGLGTFGNGPEYAAIYQAYTEFAMSGWKFREMTNNITVTATNRIEVNDGWGYIEMDQYRYVGVNPHQVRGTSAEVLTNTPYFTIGTDDNSSAEFGDGPFSDYAWYVVGSPLSNFPKRLARASGTGWPRVLHIVFNENFSQFSNTLYNKHFIIDAVTTNGSDMGNPIVYELLHATQDGLSNQINILSQAIHTGSGTKEQMYGKTDYPNLTYQDHNEVALRAPWLYNLVDDGTGWYVQQCPRGSATIEPINLNYWDVGSWILRPYEEYLFTWSHAASGVRSLFDSDQDDRLPGRASYHVGYKIGHAYGTNAFGGTEYPEVVNIRGCGYFRMADYGGIMAGSFRPVAADVFGLRSDAEDAPLMPDAYVRVVPRTTAAGEPDDSYAKAYMTFQSKTNQWFIGALEAEMHFSPDEVVNSGAYIDFNMDTWAHKAVDPLVHGPLACFAQVSMHWRGRPTINSWSEGHDIDAIMVKKTDGEWVSHQVLNPYASTYHRSLASFQSNDIVYLMQQDRGQWSYPFATETPYYQACAFEMTMLDDGGHNISLDVYETHTTKETLDNIDIVANINDSIAQGEHLNYKYRYRTIYGPGVYIVNPNDPSGGDHWNGYTYQINAYATDGQQKQLVANIYYGNGKDDDWTLINTEGPITVPLGGTDIAYDWDVSSVPAGAYYIKVTAQRTTGGKVGFDVSNTRLQIGDKYGFPHNGGSGDAITTNYNSYGSNMGFEYGSLSGWTPGADDLSIAASSTRVYEGLYSARMQGNWSGWSWNSLVQEIPCVSGETMHVTGRVFINSFINGGSDWVLCGAKMECTNGTGTASEQTFNESSTTGIWYTVDFYRTMTYDGTERLLLFTGGTDCDSADIFFDDWKVVSDQGTVVTNALQPGYWGSSSSVSVASQDVLSFWISSTTNISDLSVWVADSSSVTSSVLVSGFIDDVISVPRRVDIAWTNFTGINKSQITRIGFSPAATEAQATITKMHARDRIMNVTSVITSSTGETDSDGLIVFEPGQVITNVITLQNVSGSALSSIKVQAVQEYADDQYYTDYSDPGAFDCLYTRNGDRLCGSYEQVWSNLNIASGGSVTLTNVYEVPVGVFKESWSNFQYAFRNLASRGKTDVTVRDSSGDSVFVDDEVGLYRMDDSASYDNHSPTLNLADSYVFPVGYGSNYYVTPYDPDKTWNATVTVTYVQGPTGWNSTRATNNVITMSWTPGASDAGTTTLVSYVLNDEVGLTNSVVTNFTWAVCPSDWDNDGWNDGWEWETYGTLWNSPTNIDTPPVASNQTVNTTEDTPVGITLTGSDADTNALTFSICSGPSHGVVTGTPPSVTYTPFLDWYGTDTFTFRVHDGIVYSTVATVTVNVASDNDAPVVFNQRVAVIKNTPKAVTLTSVDPEGDTISYIIAGNPTKGVLSGTAPNLTYTPSNNITGTDSFTYRATDGGLTSAVATVSITITEANQVDGYSRAINCGGGPYTAMDGVFYERDVKYTAIHGIGYCAGTQATTEEPVNGTYDSYLYGTERYDLTDYIFDLPNGTYNVQLHFAETWYTGAAQRVFSVKMEDVYVLENVDIYAWAGRFNAMVQTISNVVVTDGQLNIHFDSSVDKSNIRAISVYGGSGAAGVTTPTGLTATGLPFKVQLSWTAIPDEDVWGYHVERADASTGTFERINPSLVVTTNFVDPHVNHDRTYYYRIYAVDHSCNTSAVSSVVSATPVQPAFVRSFTDIPACAWRRALGDIPDVLVDNSSADRGVPLGGIGAASFMYSITGSFGPWSMDVAMYEHTWLWEAAFHMYEKPASGSSTALCLATRSSPMAWPMLSEGDATYYALHPRGWITYDNKFSTDASVEFFSPVLPHNYKESSYPVAVFDWKVTNTTAQAMDVSIMLTWPNRHFPGVTRTGWTNFPMTVAGKVKGIVLKAVSGENGPETQNSEWCIATRDATNITFSYVRSWNSSNYGSDVWADFAADGELCNGSMDDSDQAAAIAAKVTLAPGEGRTIPFIISWDFPVVMFNAGTQWWKKYCEFFGYDSDNSGDIAAEAMDNYATWEQQIADWQQPFITNNLLPDWLKSTAFNELYYNQFGGVFWEGGLKYHPAGLGEYQGLHVDDNKHFELECYEYGNATAIDVRHYSSIVFANMWPEIERDFLVTVADAITFFDPVLHQTPHNMGSNKDVAWDEPANPFFTLDCYHTIDKHWKDLPSRFIQQVWRYDYMHNDPGFLDYVWPSAKQTYEYLKTRDINDDGIPDHLGDGVPDNTYDNWGAGLKGASTICGGLWVGALEAMEQMAIKEGDPILTDVQAWLAKARTNLETKLWFEEGGYYRSDDESAEPQCDSIMADALSGDRYGESYGLAPILNTNHMRCMFEQVYDRCVIPLDDATGDGVGDIGAINGLMENGDYFQYVQQPVEVWSGSTYLLAAQMYHAGLKREAMQSAYGAYQFCYERPTASFWFNTPEGWKTDGTYVRPRNPEAYQRVRAVWELVQELAPALMTYSSPPPKTAEANLALGCSVTVSSSESASYAGEYAVDGVWTSRWSSTSSDPQWIALDLGGVENISRILLNWETAYASAYRLQSSSNGTDWVDEVVVTNGNGTSDSFSFETPLQTRYVRMYGEQRATAWGYSLWEFSVYGLNLAQNKGITASSAVSNAPASMAHDGRADTGWTSVNGDTPWLEVDLGVLSQMDSVSILWGSAYATNYVIAVSVDGSTWVNVYTNTAGNGGADHIKLATPVNVRYVRVNIDGTDSCTVQEVQLFGEELDANNPPYTPSSPSPTNGAENQSTEVNLSWSGGDPDGDTVTYDVYMGIAGSIGDPLACGGYHTLVGDSNGTVYAAGYNSYYQLGDGTSANRYVPVVVSNLTDVVSLGAGAYHSLAAKSDGTAWAWGYNNYGQLGDGTQSTRTKPNLVSNLVGVAEVAAGLYHSVALMTNGTVWAWGYNNYGQLGDGTSTMSTNAIQVEGLEDVVAIAAGNYHTLAVKSDGTVWGWGYNTYGQLGTGRTTSTNRPTQMTNMTGAISVAAGYAHTLIVKTNGTVWACGRNNYYQLGDGTISTRSSPILVSNLVGGIMKVAAGYYHSAALRTNGTVYAWGYNNYGQLGDGTLTTRTNPVQVLNILNAINIAAGDYHTVVRTIDGVWGWGENNYGQLGDGTYTYCVNVVQVSNLTTAVSVAAGRYSSLAVLSNETVNSWGYNSNGQLGDGTTATRYTPILVSNLVGVTRAAGGYYHNVALMSNGTVRGWGYNSYGQLGDGSFNNRYIPVVVSNLDGVSKIAAGMYHSVALQSNGTIYAWGYNNYGQLGDGTTGLKSNATQVVNLTDAIEIAAYGYDTFAIRSNGTVWGWGYNTYGQLGNARTTSTNQPVQMTNMTAAVSVACGYYHSLVVRSDGTVWACGRNNYYQGGNGSTATWSIPVQVSNLVDGVVAVAAGEYHSVALKSDGTVWTWGYNNYGQLGDGTTNTRSKPIQMSNVVSAVAIGANGSQTLVTLSDGRVLACGFNNYGQLGNDGTPYKTRCVQVVGMEGGSLGMSLVSADQSAMTYDPGTLSENMAYVWQIIATDSRGASSTGTLWTFRTTAGLAAAPTYGPNGGTYTGSVSVTLSSTTASARIYYTTNGVGPTTNSPWVSSGGSITLYASYSNTVRAFATATGCADSTISTSTLFVVKVANNAPTAPSNPSPATGTSNVNVSASLTWTASTDPDSDPVTYDVYFGTATNPAVAATNLASAAYTPGTMATNTQYYWYVVAKDNKGASSRGPTSGSWNFRTAKSAWLDDSWSKRMSVTVTNSTAGALTNFQVRIVVPYAGDMRQDFADLRFTGTSKTNTLSFWVQDYVSAVQAIIWVKVPLINGASVTNIYMYYGNSAAASASDELGTFETNTIEMMTGYTLGTWGYGSANSDDPYNTYYHDSRAECLFKTNDLISAGWSPVKFTAMQLLVNETPGRPTLANFRIRIQNSTDSNLSSGNLASNGYTLVYGPTSVPSTNLVVSNWYSHTFSTAFYWNQTNNLLVDMSRDDTAYITNGGLRTRATTVVQTRGYYSDSNRTWPFDGTPSTRRSYVPALRIEGLFRQYIGSEPGISFGSEEDQGTPRVSAPTYSPNGGTYTGSVVVTLNSLTAGSRIYYATNGTGLTTNSPWMNSGGTITLSALYSNTVRAFATATGCVNSAITTSTLFRVALAPPTAYDQSVTTEQDTATGITLVGSVGGTNSLTYSIVSNPTNGLLSGTAPNVTYTPATNYLGVDSFTFNVTDGVSTSAPALVSVTVVPKTLYVDGSNTSGIEDGTLQYPFNTIQEGVAACLAGGTVLVSNGTYALTTTIEITNSITVRSINGPAVTIVDGTNGVRCFYINNAAAVVDGLTITRGNPQGTSYGGGLDIYDNGGLVQNCVIISNYAYGAGGAYAYSSNAKFRNCLVAYNECFTGGGGLYLVSSASAENCTIVRNKSTSYAGGVYNGGSAVIRNSIVWYNTASTNQNMNDNGAGTTFSCSPVVADGANNTTNEPKFVNAAAGDYRLFPGANGSPCIDTGTNVSWTVGAKDLLGQNRISGGTVDMGAYEFQKGALAAFLEGDVLDGLAPVTTVFQAYVGGTNTTGLYYAWDFDNNGSVDQSGSGLAKVTNVYSQGGLFSVSLRVTNSVGEIARITNVQYVYVSPSTMYVSAQGSHTFPYDTWAKASHDLQTPIEAARNGVLILITNGTYVLSSQVNVNKSLTLRSVNGPASTVIDGNWTSRCFYVNAATNVEIDGLTITRGAATNEVSGSYGYGGGLYLYWNCSNILVQNCIITSNRAQGYYGGGIYMSANSTLRNCLFTYNNATSAYGGGVYSDGTGNKIINCTIARNAARYNGGGVYVSSSGLKIYNSIIYSNTVGGGTVENWYMSGSSPVCSNTCSTPLLTNGQGNITSYPMFVDPVGGNFRLAVSSPCIDTGMLSEAPTNDLDRNSRPWDGDGDSIPEIDMGAYEAHLTNQIDLTLSEAVSASIVTQGTLVVYTVTVTNKGPLAASSVVVSNQMASTNLIYMRGSATQGSYAYTNGAVMHYFGVVSSGSWARGTFTMYPRLPGVYTNRSTATAVEYDGVSTNNSTVAVTTVMPGTPVLYTDVGNTNEIKDGTTLASAFNTIMESVGISAPGATIHVAAGTYTESVTLYYRSNLTLRGSAESSILSNLSYKFDIQYSRDITASGFRFSGGTSGAKIYCSTNITFVSNTVENISQGSYSYGGAFYIYRSIARLEDNIISSCYGGQMGGAGYCIDSGLCALYNDVINCTAWNSGGGFYLSVSVAGRTNRFSSNYFYGNSSDYSGAIDLNGSGLQSTWVDHNTFVQSGGDWQSGGSIQIGYASGASTSRIMVLNNVVYNPLYNSYYGDTCIKISTGMVYIANNILYGRGGSTVGIYNYYGSSNNVLAEYNDVYNVGTTFVNLTTGTNLFVNPLFVSATNGDFQLMTNSPCIDAGNPAAFYNDADSTRNDMGVYGGNY